jgi:hypothetical protein
VLLYFEPKDWRPQLDGLVTLTLTVYVVNIVMCLYMANYLSLVNWWTKVRGNDDIRAYNGGKKGLRVVDLLWFQTARV